MVKQSVFADWAQIEESLSTLRKVEGGFSRAKRGIVTLDNGDHVFVKQGLHNDTRQWAQKEVAVYRFLEKHHYPYAPKLLATNHTQTSFAISAHTLEEGWDWQENWTNERLDKTLEAMDALAAIQPTVDEREHLFKETINESHNGWQSLLRSRELQSVLLAKLGGREQHQLADTLDFIQEAAKSQRFIFQNTTLVHNDVRADNCAWHAARKEVRLVDWNWAQIGDQRLDIAATLTHIQKSGYNVLPRYADRLDWQALQWLAGFWFNSASRPIWEGGPTHLRDLQLHAGITAFSLAKQLGNN